MENFQLSKIAVVVEKLDNCLACQQQKSFGKNENWLTGDSEKFREFLIVDDDMWHLCMANSHPYDGNFLAGRATGFKSLGGENDIGVRNRPLLLLPLMYIIELLSA